MPISSGTRLGPYEILAPLGAGGMGEVYRARDTRLGRTVAIKILAADCCDDPERRSRFEREARAIAALSHPHICTLHDIGRQDGTDFIVMELLEGKTLAARLESGQISVDEAVLYAIQIAEALDAAHRQGIVHRDLKPANVMLTRSGAKLLDFGLAAMRAEDPALTEGATRSAPITREGTVMGTLPYMAPEQLEGKAVDTRTDIFAFGAVVFEMITGKRPFEGNSEASLIGAILHTPAPPIRQVKADAPAALERVLAVCLSKDPETRWSSIHDVLLQLRGMSEASESSTARVGRHVGRRERVAGGAAIITAIALTAALLGRRAPAPAEVAGLDLLSILPPEQTTRIYGEAPEVSPDGRRVAFVATDGSGRSSLYVRSLDSLAARLLPDTDGASLPFWAPDSRRIGFFAEGQLKTIALAGGPSHTLARAPVPRGGAWSRDDVVLFTPMPNQPPLRVPAAGGEATPVPIAGPILGFRSFPAFLPDGRHYVYLARIPREGSVAIEVASLDSAEIKQVVRSKASAAYVPPGYLLFRREAQLVAQRLDASTLQLSGSPMPVVDDVGFNPLTFQALFSASDNGVLAYQRSTPGSQFVWFDRQGKRLGVAASPGDYNAPCLTADEKRIVYQAADPISGNVDLWAIDLAGGAPSRLTFHPAVDVYPVCSPAGPEIVFSSLRDGPPNLYRLALSAPGSEKELLRSPLAKIASDWSR
ncbi:MAG TPA: protein kinase, partial [Solirubrobacterales bacterium]